MIGDQGAPRGTGWSQGNKETPQITSEDITLGLTLQSSATLTEHKLKLYALISAIKNELLFYPLALFPSRVN